MNGAAEFLVQLEGDFDLRAAERVAEALACVQPGGALRLDLSRVREFHAAGLAALARTLRVSGRAVRVVVRGLRQHQRRLLGYLGVDLDALEGAVVVVPAGG
jgi:anti-anti-sigma regulatory factor